MELLHVVIDFLIDTIGSLGYFGIFFLMFLESTFFPFPSEVVIIPAGYLAYKGEMNIFLVILMGILGSLIGALLNYYLSKTLGRKLLLKYGHYIWFKEDKLIKMEKFFKSHGDISTFNGRLIPVIRQYISLPAGLSNMNILKFSIYTSLGAGIWVTILALLGYFLGSNGELIEEHCEDLHCNISLYNILVVASKDKVFVWLIQAIW
ncbi:MAG: DedA family protein [Sulfurospirillum sp.]|nr:DedA family protein [Sulfurospirillum sp.]